MAAPVHRCGYCELRAEVAWGAEIRAQCEFAEWAIPRTLSEETALTRVLAASVAVRSLFEARPRRLSGNEKCFREGL